MEYLRYLEQRIQEKLTSLNGLMGRLSLRTVVAWAAHRVQRIPAGRIADYYGYKDDDSVRSLVGRFQARLGKDPALNEALASVIVSASRFR